MEGSFLIGMVSACTALVASIVGPIVALSVAKRQFNATAISTSRSRRIDTLRDELAELISLLASALVVKSKWKGRWEEGRGPMNSEPGLLDKFERIVLAQSKVQMLINPDDENHQRLGETIDDAIHRIQSEDAADADTKSDIRTIIVLGQAIMKSEWHRVKLGT
jgi:hypothetical protein